MPQDSRPQAARAPLESRLSYLGVGCVGAIVGLVGGGMIAVFIAKVVGGLTSCGAEPDSGAPCGWTVYWTWGARIGVVLVPAVSILLLRRGRQRPRNLN